MEFLHIGVPTKKVQPDETYAEGMKVHLTNPDVHDMKFEYLRFEPGSWLPAIMQVTPHIAVKVELDPGGAGQVRRGAGRAAGGERDDDDCVCDPG